MNIINIKDLNDERLSLYAKLSENQLRRYFEPEPGVFVAESPNVIERALNAGYEPLSFLVETEAIDKEAGVILEKVSKIYGKEKAEEIPVKDLYYGGSGQSHQCRRYLPVGSGAWYGCGASDPWMRGSFIQKSSEGEHGNGFSDSLDYP